jgi:hypothetical protein
VAAIVPRYAKRIASINQLLSIRRYQSIHLSGRTDMGGNAMMMTIGLILVFPFIFYFLKSWLFATGTPGSTFHRVRRIAEMDGHLSFDERLAEKLRELERGKQVVADEAPPPPDDPAPQLAPPPKGFGRRGL